MIHLIIGGSGSGKSAFAEKCAVEGCESFQSLFYLATMIPFGREAEMRIKRHREARHGYGFITLERHTDIGKLSEEYNINNSILLLESLSDLAANELFKENGEMNDPLSTEDKIYTDILRLEKTTDKLIVVSDDIFRDGMIYTAETDTYMQMLGRLHIRIAGLSDVVTEVVSGIPCVRKGGVK